MPNLRAAGLRHATHYIDVLRDANRCYLQGHGSVKRGLALFESEWDNIRAGQSWAASNAGKGEAIAQLCSDYPEAGAYVLDLRQHPHERIRWREAALAASRRLNRRKAEGWHLGNLGLAFWALGDFQRAIEYYQQALAIAQETSDCRNEAITLGNLGMAYWSQGNIRHTIELCEQALAIARAISDRHAEGLMLNNLGIAHAASGETREAIDLFEKYLAITREIGDRRGEGNVLGNLGIAYKNLGNLGKAHLSQLKHFGTT